MPTALIDGILTNYEVVGSGPPLLMFAPGGFNATLENWRSFSVYGRYKPLDHLPERYTCIVFDQRESGRSGGRVESLSWSRYAAHGKGLLDHLGIERAHVMGGCMGCSSVVALAVAHPETVRSMILFWPAGGPKYRLKNHDRFMRHRAYVREAGLEGVAAVARGHEQPFTQDARIGPWGTILRHDDAFVADYTRLDPQRYDLLVAGMAKALFDRDTVAGAEPEDLLRLDTPALIVPGEDASHAPSAARYLQECLSGSAYWDVPVAEQTERTVPPRLLDFLDSIAEEPASPAPRS